MSTSKQTRFAGRLIGFLVALVAATVIASFGKWFDHLKSTPLFLVVFGTIAFIWYGTEWFYRREYSRDNVSQPHLEELKETAKALGQCFREKRDIQNVESKDRRELFSHRHDLRRECAKWDKAVAAWHEARKSYEQKLEASFEDNRFVGARFNEPTLKQNIGGATRDREMRFQLGLGPKPEMVWVWDYSPITQRVPPRDLMIRSGNTSILFVRAFDDPSDPVDEVDCKYRLITLFNQADSSQELKEWVRTELELENSDWATKLKDSMHDFWRLDHLRHGRGCMQCNS